MRIGWRDVVFGAVFLAPPFLKRTLLRVCLGAEVAPTARLGWFASVRGRTVRLGAHSHIRALTLVRCEGDVRLGRYAEVSSFTLVYGAGGFALGEHSYVGPQCLINTDDDVRIGDRSALGPRCMVFTHGSFLPFLEGYPVRLAPVSVGDRTWLAAGVFVHPGVRVGDDVLVNSCAVVQGDVPGGSVVEGNPARVVFPIERVKRRMTPARVDEAMRGVLARFAEIVLERALRAEVVAEGRDVLRVRLGGRSYRVMYVPAVRGPASPTWPAEAGTRGIVLCNDPAWRPPVAAKDVAVVDLAAMRIQPSGDPVEAELIDFLRRYYGVKLEHREAPAATPSEAAATAEDPSWVRS
jgi:acetyltransferase-like isoleucine patch superfamily enzyme